MPNIAKNLYLPLKPPKFSSRFARKRYQKPQFTLENHQNLCALRAQKALDLPLEIRKTQNFLRASREK